MESLEVELNRPISGIFSRKLPVWRSGGRIHGLLKQKYNLDIDTHSAAPAEAYATVNNLADFIVSQLEPKTV